MIRRPLLPIIILAVGAGFWFYMDLSSSEAGRSELAPAGLFLSTAAFGLWLSHRFGKPGRSGSSDGSSGYADSGGGSDGGSDGDGGGGGDGD